MNPMTIMNSDMYPRGVQVAIIGYKKNNDTISPKVFPISAAVLKSARKNE